MSFIFITIVYLLSIFQKKNWFLLAGDKNLIRWDLKFKFFGFPIKLIKIFGLEKYSSICWHSPNKSQ